MTEIFQYERIGAFDVLEHIEQNEKVLSNLHLGLKPGWALLLTLPQHPRLWSIADEHACHVRHYTRAELIGKVELAGLSVEYLTSFVSLHTFGVGD